MARIIRSYGEVRALDGRGRVYYTFQYLLDCGCLVEIDTRAVMAGQMRPRDIERDHRCEVTALEDMYRENSQRGLPVTGLLEQIREVTNRKMARRDGRSTSYMGVPVVPNRSVLPGDAYFVSFDEGISPSRSVYQQMQRYVQAQVTVPASPARPRMGFDPGQLEPLRTGQEVARVAPPAKKEEKKEEWKKDRFELIELD